MDADALIQFRRQLAAWIEARLASQRLPFQRLELCPRILTARGELVPDMILWINRQSQLAGSLVLLPDRADEQLASDGAALADALGLGHFVTWETHAVSIWHIVDGTEASRQQSWQLPPANRVLPADFQATLDRLLNRLKVVTVTSALPPAEFSVYYFANLCLRALEELTPGLIMSARTAAGQTGANEWLEEAPRSKSWLSLWRVISLVWSSRLPPGLQPERLELAIRYALQDLPQAQMSWLEIREDEAPLSVEDAIRLHHLAGRLRQLGWPHSRQQAVELLDLLLAETARQFQLEPPDLPWGPTQADLWVNSQPPVDAQDCSLIAPRAFLAGWALKSSWTDRERETKHAENLQSLAILPAAARVVANLWKTSPLARKTLDARLVLLRQAWPSRRFDLPRSTPTWVWEAFYLSGLASIELSLLLPHDWHLAPGVSILWDTLMERYQLAEMAVNESGAQSLRLVRNRTRPQTIAIHRLDQSIRINCRFLDGKPPGATQAWLRGTDQVVEILRSRAMADIDTARPDPAEAWNWGLYLFLNTRLGSYLWTLCNGRAFLPDPDEAKAAVLAAGMPVPNPTILADLGLTGEREIRTLPAPDVLEKEFVNIFGPVPDLPDHISTPLPDTPPRRRRSSLSVDQIAGKVFTDGIPCFPDHYLMRLYRPRLLRYRLAGPLEITAVFFDRFSLQAIGQDQVLEVSGRTLADALILASYAGATEVDLPQEELMLATLVRQYRSDLEKLWGDLIGECRRCQPHLQAALKLARTIWQQQGLPPDKVLENLSLTSG